MQKAKGLGGGGSLLANVFGQNALTPSYFTFTLGRGDVLRSNVPLGSENPTGITIYPGNMTIGEVLPGMEAVLARPKLEVTQVQNAAGAGSDGGDAPSSSTVEQHWQVLLDPDGVKVRGQTIKLPTSTAKGAPVNTGQLTAMFDSGFSLPQVPKYGSLSLLCLHSGHG
jgi:hypothetical protein